MAVVLAKGKGMIVSFYKNSIDGQPVFVQAFLFPPHTFIPKSDTAPLGHTREFLKTAWMKEDKQQRAPYILLITRRFNEVRRDYDLTLLGDKIICVERTRY